MALIPKFSYTIHCNFAKLQNLFRIRRGGEWGGDENARSSGAGSMKFSKSGAGLQDRYYDYHDWNIMQVA